jgi:hypothetical protein
VNVCRLKEFPEGRPGSEASPQGGSWSLSRGGGWSQSLDGEGVLADLTLESALYWRQIYSEMLEMEEKVLARIDLLMDAHSEQVKREVEMTNVPAVVAQAERFRQRLGFWEARVTELDIRHHNRI